ncbi:hypothetical protein KCP73_12675 [Salmonella enterica subsp. enterica]|nr:hypothetical protein KCP73_12675 [Salmonella enterica subsp. enterica]
MNGSVRQRNSGRCRQNASQPKATPGRRQRRTVDKQQWVIGVNDASLRELRQTLDPLPQPRNSAEFSSSIKKQFGSTVLLSAPLNRHAASSSYSTTVAVATQLRFSVRGRRGGIRTVTLKPMQALAIPIDSRFRLPVEN